MPKNGGILSAFLLYNIKYELSARIHCEIGKCMELNQQIFLIRPFEERDRSSLKNLWERCDLTVHYNDLDHDIDFAVNSPSSKILVGELKKRLIASIMVGHDGHRGWLYYVAVDPDYQKCGYGRAMVSGAENWLKDKGVR